MLTNEIMQNQCKIIIGDKVIVRKRQRNQNLSFYDLNSCIVCSTKSNVIVATRDGHELIRNSSPFKKVSRKVRSMIVIQIIKDKKERNKTENSIL